GRCWVRRQTRSAPPGAPPPAPNRLSRRLTPLCLTRLDLPLSLVPRRAPSQRLPTKTFRFRPLSAVGAQHRALRNRSSTRPFQYIEQKHDAQRRSRLKPLPSVGRHRTPRSKVDTWRSFITTARF